MRRPVVAQLSAAGMSTRAIAPIIGADQKTVVNDRRALREELSSPSEIRADDFPELSSERESSS